MTSGNRATRQETLHPNIRPAARPQSTPDQAISATGVRPRIAAVGFAATQPLSPRGERFNVLSEALAEVAEVEMITEARDLQHRGPSRSKVRRATNRLARTILLDAHEIQSARRLRRWPASVDAGVLVGFPFSPLSWAARRLAGVRVPYVVDIGDPWALTGDRPRLASPALARARRCERFMWEHAAGGIVTTELQAEAIRGHFRDLPILVQPNGFAGENRVSSTVARKRPDRRELRIVHYGNLYEPRLELRSFLQSIAACGLWNAVRFTLYGCDWRGSLGRVGANVDVEIRAPLPWREIVAGAIEHDFALVVGNRNPGQLPSKAVQYLTLPIPRVALVSGAPSEALEAYVSDKRGWLTIRATGDPAHEGALLAAHLRRPWSLDDLQAPESESWAAVTARIVAFVFGCASLSPWRPPA